MQVSIANIEWGYTSLGLDAPLRSLGLNLQYDGQQTDVTFWSVADVSLEDPSAAVRLKLSQLIGALAQLERSPELLSAALRQES